MSMTDLHANASVGDFISVVEWVLAWANISIFRTLIALISAVLMLMSFWVVTHLALLVTARVCAGTAFLMAQITFLMKKCMGVIIDHIKAGLAFLMRSWYRKLVRRKRK
ncbi:hypothetical protein ACSV5G_10805 [Agrobacterium cavarae]|uniref:hypothetical protein n=1 Tax=Agrobacterium cavarae TaxID=2528239 RepID=UPI003FCFC99F